METSAPTTQTPPLVRDDSVLNHFRRLRGQSDALRGGNPQALRDYLVLVHASLVEHCARTFLSSGEPLEDLMQEGTIGLIKAVDRFDPEKGVRFSTYACHLIAGAMRHYLRDLGKIIHEPGWHAELRLQISRASDDLTQKLGRAPQPEEIASALDMQAPTVRRVLDAGNVLAVTSLDAEKDDEEGVSVKTNTFDETDFVLGAISTSVENRLVLNQALPQLRDLEQRAVTLFYYGEHSKTEIARQMGISVNYAAYLVKRGVEQLRRIIESEAPITVAPPPAPLPLLWRDLTRWIEDSALRDGTPREFALLLCRIENWENATSRLSPSQKTEAQQNAAGVMRRSCRKADKVVAVAEAPFGGLSFLALMPNTGASGERAGERWRRACNATSVGSGLEASGNTSPSASAPALSEIDIEYSFACSEGETSQSETSVSPAQIALNALMHGVLSRHPRPLRALSHCDEESAQRNSDNYSARREQTSDGISLAADGTNDLPQLL